MLVTPGYERVKATDHSNTFKVNNKVFIDRLPHAGRSHL